MSKPITIAQAKEYVRDNGGLLKGESLNDALKRLPDYHEAVEKSRMKSVLQAGRTCHDCNCHLWPPCSGCVECPTCNAEESDTPAQLTKRNPE